MDKEEGVFDCLGSLVIGIVGLLWSLIGALILLLIIFPLGMLFPFTIKNPDEKGTWNIKFKLNQYFRELKSLFTFWKSK